MPQSRESLAADKQELLEVLYRYCRAVDRRDYDLLRTVYHPDAVDEHGGIYSGPVEEFITTIVPTVLESFSVTTHMVANAIFHVDGDRAEGESYALCSHITKDDEPANVVVSARYLDKFERRDGEWRILHRVCVADWSNISAGLDQGGPKGQPGRGDASYSALSMFDKV